MIDMSEFLDICSTLNQINLSNIKEQKRGRMALVVTHDARLESKNISKMGEYYMTFTVIDPTVNFATRCSLFTKNFVSDLSFFKGDIIVGKFYESRGSIYVENELRLEIKKFDPQDVINDIWFKYFSFFTIIRDTMLNVSKSVTAERGFITPLTTPKKSLAPLPEPVSVKGGSPELSHTPSGFTLQYQSDWDLSEVRTVEVYLTGFYPKEQEKWNVKVCPICKEWDSHLACNCNVGREDSVYFSIHLKTDPSSKYAITASICGPEGDDIIKKIDIVSMLNDGRKHKFTLLKIVPYEKSGLGYTFLVLNVLQ